MEYKRPRKPVRWQKECLSAHHLKVDDWLILEETEFYLKIINTKTKKTKHVDKFRREKRRR